MQQRFFGEFLKKTSRKKRKHALDQENDQEKKRFFFSWSLSWSRACFVFLLYCLLLKNLGANFLSDPGKFLDAPKFFSLIFFDSEKNPLPLHTPGHED